MVRSGVELILSWTECLCDDVNIGTIVVTVSGVEPLQPDPIDPSAVGRDDEVEECHSDNDAANISAESHLLIPRLTFNDMAGWRGEL